MRFYLGYILSAVLLLSGSCSSGGSDPMAASTDGSSLSGQNLANATVYESTGVEFYMLFLNQIHQTYLKALSSTSQFASEGGTVNFLGNFTGNALATATLDTTSALIPELSIKYSNFSDTGTLFYAGTIRYSSVWQGTGSSHALYSLVLNGKAEFAGAYAGTIEFQNMKVGLDAAGRPVDLVERAQDPQRDLPLNGNVIIVSGDEVFNFNPNMVDHPIGPIG